MNTIIKIVSCDTETTSLNPKTGHIRAIGLSIATVNLATGCEVAERIRLEASAFPWPQHWNPKTIEWAKQQGSWPRRVQYDELSVIFEALRKFLSSSIDKYELKEALWVFNHTDFDVPFLDQLFPFKDVVKYSCIYDLQSLMIGRLGIYGKDKAFQCQKDRLGPVTHGAIEDADRQLELILDHQLFRL